MTATDAELVARVRRGDLAGYAELVTRHRSSLERFAYHLLGSREDAEDALQDTLLRGYRAIDRCEQPERVRSWLLQILINRCRTRLTRREPIVRDAAADQALDRAVVPDESEGAAWREEIQRALAALAPEQREAFLLKHVEELTYEEISALTAVTVPALKMRVSRACERLRQLLKDVYHAG
ncbi:MAG: RNA polymerase sigma factor [Gemmatimonadota bacterium]